MSHHGHSIDSVFLFEDRIDAGVKLAREVERFATDDAVVVGITRGGVVVGAAVARELGLPLDAVAESKDRHPRQPEHVLGAVESGGAAAIHGSAGLAETELCGAALRARVEAVALQRQLHSDRQPVPLADRVALLVDDGIATGATMRAAARWARRHGARRIVAAAPVGARQAVFALADAVDAVVCPHPVDGLIAVGLWYARFDNVDDDELARLLAKAPAVPAALPSATEP
jgi:putative phosphoribosyl transferase